MNKTELKILHNYIDWLYYYCVQGARSYSTYTCERKRTYTNNLPESHTEKILLEEYQRYCAEIYSLCRAFDEIFESKYSLHVEYINTPEVSVTVSTPKTQKPLLRCDTSGFHILMKPRTRKEVK